MAFGKTIAAATGASYSTEVTEVVFFNEGRMKRTAIASAAVGIASQCHPDGLHTLAVALYWQPRLDIWSEVSRKTTIGPLETRFQVEHIFGVDALNPRNPDKPLSYRIFPRRPKPAHADVQRAQGVTWGPGNELWCTRNADGRIFVLEPPLPGSDRWRHTRTHRLTNRLIHAVYFRHEDDTLWTIESELDEMDNGEWRIVAYHYNRGEKRFARGAEEPGRLPYMTYGITRRPGDSEFWYGADIRGPRPTGIYRGHKLIVPLEVGVNGLAFLADGSAVAMFYGESSVGKTHAMGRPSELIYVPAKVIEQILGKLKEASGA